ncbi:MAG: hypothetical protein J6N49_00970 [Alphaproteobacteria bacterium]|nr:hypothetical protein [Alphaproteobacteria bacterium]
MRKIILILFILLCGISAVSAQTVQRTVKKPNFFMPQNAMQSQTTQNRNRQVQKVGTPASAQPKAKIVRPNQTNVQKTANSTSTAGNGVIKKIVKAPASLTRTQQTAKINRPTAAPKQPLPTPEKLVQNPTKTDVVDIVPLQNPQPEPTVNNNDPFQIIFTDYFKDTATINEGKSYKNPRLDSVIANFVDKEHTLD